MDKYEAKINDLINGYNCPINVIQIASEHGFKVFTGSWIKKFPECKTLIIDEFQLPNNVEFIQDEHWDIGHGWSDEF